MKSIHSLFSLIILTLVIASSGLAQDNTKVGLPDGAIARLGKGGINIMRFSPDGSKLAVGTDVGLWLYDVADGKATALFTDLPGKVYALAFSDDGRILASGGARNLGIQLWNLENDTRHSIFFFKNGIRTVNAMSFLRNILISYDNTGRVTYWNISNGDILSELERVEPHGAVTFSPNSNSIFVADSLGKIHIYDTSLSDKHIIFQDDEVKDIDSFAVTSKKIILVSGGLNSSFNIWDIEEQRLTTSLIGHKSTITSVAVSPNEKLFASADAKKEIILWDVEDPKKLRTLTGHKSPVNALTFSPDGPGKYSGCLASGSNDGTIRFWDPDTGEQLVTLAKGHTKWIKAIAFSEDGSTLVSANMTGSVSVWSLDGYQKIATFTNGESDYAYSVAFSNDAKYFVCQGLNKWEFTFKKYGFGYTSGSDENYEILPIRMWNMTTGKEVLGPWNEHSCNILAFSPDKKILAIYGSEDVLGWNIDSAEELFNLSTGELSFKESMVISPDNKLVAMYESSEKPYIWNIEKSEDLPKQINTRVHSLAFSPDGDSIAIFSESLLLHEIKSFPDGKPVEIHTNRGGPVKMIFSPDSKILVCTGIFELRSNNKMKLWDVETGEEIRALSGHTEHIQSLAFSHDGKILATGSFDGTVLLWDWEKISKR